MKKIGMPVMAALMVLALVGGAAATFYYTLTWSSTAMVAVRDQLKLYTDAACTIPFVGTHNWGNVIRNQENGELILYLKNEGELARLIYWEQITLKDGVSTALAKIVLYNLDHAPTEIPSGTNITTNPIAAGAVLTLTFKLYIAASIPLGSSITSTINLKASDV